MKKFLFACFAVVALTACSSDDSPAPVTPGQNVNVIGTWKEVSYQVTHDSEWTVINCDDTNMWGVLYTFNANGTFTASQYCENSINDFPDVNATYTILGDVLTTNAPDNVITYKVTKEGENTLYMHRFVTQNGETMYHAKYKLEKQ